MYFLPVAGRVSCMQPIALTFVATGFSCTRDCILCSLISFLCNIRINQSNNAVSHLPCQFQFEQRLQQPNNVGFLSKQCFLSWLCMSASKLKFWSLYRPWSLYRSSCRIAWCWNIHSEQNALRAAAKFNLHVLSSHNWIAVQVLKTYVVTKLIYYNFGKAVKIVLRGLVI